MTKSELKSIIRECYEEVMNENLDSINEGVLFNKSKNHTVIQEKIKSILHENSEKLSFKERFRMKPATASIPFIDKAINSIRSYADAISFTNAWITYVDYTEDHAARYCTILKDDGVFEFEIKGMYHELSLGVFSSSDVSSLGTISKDIIKLALENNDPKYDIRFSKNTIACKQVQGVTGLSSNKRLYDTIEKYVNSKYPDYDVKYNKVTGKLTISK